jgi:hypothetical protein
MRKIHVMAIIAMFVINGILVFNTGNGKSQDVYQYDNSDFDIIPKYTYIRSYPNGGGIFIIYMKVDLDFSGFVILKLQADENLNAQLQHRILNKYKRTTEITIHPNDLVNITTYQIKLIATHISPSIDPVSNHHEIQSLFITNSESKIVFLDVEMFPWSSGNLPDAIIKRDEFINWLAGGHPEFGMFSAQDCFAYCTYPQILIVEHWTFLYDKWEMRICYHVMIPPYDWSILWLRNRGDVKPVFAAYRESDGTIFEIPVSEYPIFYGY